MNNANLVVGTKQGGRILWWLQGGMVAAMVTMIAIFNLVDEPIYVIAGLSLIFLVLFIIYTRKVKELKGKPQGESKSEVKQ